MSAYRKLSVQMVNMVAEHNKAVALTLDTRGVIQTYVELVEAVMDVISETTPDLRPKVQQRWQERMQVIVQRMQEEKERRAKKGGLVAVQGNTEIEVADLPSTPDNP